MGVRVLGLKEVWSVQKAWREVFARRQHRLTGRWTRGSDRDVFDSKMMKYLQGRRPRRNMLPRRLKPYMSLTRKDGTVSSVIVLKVGSQLFRSSSKGEVF